MAITAAQRNAGYRQLCIKLAEGRPDRVAKLFRFIVSEIHDGATATQKDIAKAIAVELYESAFGVPFNARQCRKWLERILQDRDGETDSLGIDDAVEFQPPTVT